MVDQKKQLIKRGQGQWNAYVAAGKTLEERQARLAEVPEQYVRLVKCHLEIIWSIKKYQKNVANQKKQE